MVFLLKRSHPAHELTSSAEKGKDQSEMHPAVINKPERLQHMGASITYTGSSSGLLCGFLDPVLGSWNVWSVLGKGVCPNFWAPAHPSQIQLQFVAVLASVYPQPVFQRLLRSPAGLKLEIEGEVGCSPSL